MKRKCKLSEAQRKAMQNIVQGFGPAFGIKGRSQHGGFHKTMLSLHENLLADYGFNLTEVGKKALQTGHYMRKRGGGMSETLKPCPFCGGPAEIKIVYGSWGYTLDWVTVGCKSCEIAFSEKADDDYVCAERSIHKRATEIAVKRWNTRK